MVRATTTSSLWRSAHEEGLPSAQTELPLKNVEGETLIVSCVMHPQMYFLMGNLHIPHFILENADGKPIYIVE